LLITTGKIASFRAFEGDVNKVVEIQNACFSLLIGKLVDEYIFVKKKKLYVF